MNANTCCTRDELNRFVHDIGTSADDPRILAHLEECADCQRALEAAAGEPAWWQEVGSQLSSLGNAHSSNPYVTAETTEATWLSLKAYLAPSDDPTMLGRLGLYEIRGIIGRGGAGIVLKAFDPLLHRFVAIKALLPYWADNINARERFAREAKAAAAVAHEHVVPIHAVDEFHGIPYIVMKYVTGGSLEHRLQGHGPFPLEMVLRIALQTALALAAAHQQGLVHRDIKPANILLEPGVDRVLVTDFGLARSTDDATLTCTGFVAGTPRYMSPEQARGDHIDARSDLFGLGCVLYEMCAGHPPFSGESLIGILHQVCEKPHRSLRDEVPGIPDWLSALVDKLLEKSPQNRFQSADEVAQVLTAELAHWQNPRGVSRPKRNYQRASYKRNRLLGIVMLSTLLISAISYRMYVRYLPEQRDIVSDSVASPSLERILSEETLTRQTEELSKEADSIQQSLWPHFISSDAKPNLNPPRDAQVLWLKMTQLEYELNAEFSIIDDKANSRDAKQVAE